MEDTLKPWGPFETPFDALGGEAKIRSIVDRFYDIIDTDAPSVRAMLPKDDSASREKLSAYLTEWTGGPELYAPFAIGADEVAVWLSCFGRSLDENDVTGPIREFLDDKIGVLALHMQNQP